MTDYLAIPREQIHLVPLGINLEGYEGPDRREVYVMDYDGHDQRQVTAHQTLSMSPDWSPNGEKLAYVSYLRGSPGIFMAELRTGAKSPVVVEGNPLRAR